jgi:tetratricopeptide (TPR) repeat protein
MIVRPKPGMRWFLFLFCSFWVLPSVELFAQQNWYLPISGRVLITDEKKNKDVDLEGAMVTLSRSGSAVNTVTTTGNGKYSFKLDPNSEYTISITKPGFITKKIAVSTRNVPYERASHGFAGYDMQVTIFEMFPGIDYSVLNNPVAKIVYNPTKDFEDFDYDKGYSDQIRAASAKLEELARMARENEKKFAAAIAQGDKAFQNKDYAGAKAAYSQAGAIKPNETYPKDQIKTCDTMLAKAGADAKVDADYKAAIATADGAMTAKNYDAAKTAYLTAAGIKPAETYPKQKLKEIDDLAAKLISDKALNDKYTAAIKKGDDALAAKSYEAAKTAYTEASGLKPAEGYPKQKLKDLDDLMAKAKAAGDLDAKYQAAVKKGDDAMSGQTYDVAKSAFTEASSLKPAEAYPKQKLKEIDDLAAKAKAAGALDANYQAAVKKADDAFAAKSFDAAKASYTLAAELKPAETYPKQKLKEIGDLLAKSIADKALNEKYAAALKKGDEAFSTKDYATAKTAFTDALALKPTEQYPKDKLKTIADLQAKAANDLAAKGKFDAAIARGDKAMGAKDYAGAKLAFNEAIGLKSDEQYPKDKIKEIDSALARETADKEKNARYQGAIAKADLAFKSKKYDEAKAGYNEALGIRSDDTYPKDQIKAIDALLSKSEAEKALNEKYNAAIAKADASFKAKDYNPAKTFYTDALALKSAETYPKTQLKAIDELLNKDKASKELDDRYNAAIKKGDDAFIAKDYASAKAGFTEANALKATEQYPKDKLKAIADLLGKDAKEKELRAKYDAAIAKGDKAMSAKDYLNAKTAFNEALTYKAEEQYPKDKLKELDELLSKDVASKALNAKYQAALAKGDLAFKAKKYEEAKSAYAEASGTKPDETYPKAQIKAIDDLLNADLANKALNEKYNAALTKADAAFKGKDYENARTAYTEAGALKPTEAYPKSQLKSIDDLLSKDVAAKEKYQAAIKKGDAALAAKDYPLAKTAYSEASAIRSAEQYPKDKLKELEDLLAKLNQGKELEGKYVAAIAKGDHALKAKSYTAAQTAFTEAGTLKPSEQYPKDKLKEIADLLKNADSQKEKNARYTAAIGKADIAFKSKKYEEAKAGYTEAQSIKPEEEYPPARLKEIDDLIAKEGSMKDINSRYSAAIAKGDEAFQHKDYTAAKEAYTNALSLKAAEVYPKKQLEAIDLILAKEEKDKNLGDKYNRAVQEGDKAFAKEDYPAAKSSFTEANSLRPNEMYPKDKLSEIARAIVDKIKREELEAKYKEAVAKGNAAFAAKDYMNAKAAYLAGLGFKPADAYCTGKLSEIDNLVQSQDSQAKRDKKYNEAIVKADKAFKAKDYSAAKSAYAEALAAKPNEAYPKQRILECDAKMNKTKVPDAVVIKDPVQTRNDLAKKYGEGVTELAEVNEGNCRVLTKIVVHGADAWRYTQKTYSWGAVYFFKDDSEISKAVFDAETK